MPEEHPLAAARFPRVAARRGHYESFYVKAAAPAGASALWLRYTAHKRPGDAPVGSLWCTLFRAGLRPAAVKETVMPGSLAAGGGALVRVGASRLGADGATGSAGAGRARWDLRFAAAEPPFTHLPSPLLYRTPLPRTKSLSLAPLMRVSGSVEVDGDHVVLDGWPGMLGHNWGAEHAERWIWLHGVDDAGDWLDVALARIRLGGRTTPWIANGCLSLGGRRRRIRGTARVEEDPLRARFEAGGLRGSVSAPSPEEVVVFRYADPAGGEHHTAHCSVATLEASAGGRTLRCAGGAAYELGMRERDHGLPVEPYPDP